MQEREGWDRVGKENGGLDNYDCLHRERKFSTPSQKCFYFPL
jgi:hypothetical protein